MHYLGGGNDPRKVYGDTRRPKVLTSKERLRFSRAYYQLLSLLWLQEADRQHRLQSITNLRHLYYLYELSFLEQSVGKAEVLSVIPGSRYSGSPQRIALRDAIWDRLGDVYRSAHGKEPEDVQIYGMEDGYMWYVVMWDHWQDNLRQVICGLQPTELGQQAALDKTHLWESDEEESDV